MQLVACKLIRARHERNRVRTLADNVGRHDEVSRLTSQAKQSSMYNGWLPETTAGRVTWKPGWYNVWKIYGKCVGEIHRHLQEAAMGVYDQGEKSISHDSENDNNNATRKMSNIPTWSRKLSEDFVFAIVGLAPYRCLLEKQCHEMSTGRVEC